MKTLVIVGASGDGKVVADIAVQNGYKDIMFLDDNEQIKECLGFPVVGKSSSYLQFAEKCVFFVAIGNPKVSIILDARKANKEKIEHIFYEEPIPVYNLTVDDFHTFLITKYELLVHNTPSK